jgi:hypothetical protein
MTFARIASVPSLLALFALAGCNTAAQDPLTGTWTNTTCFGSTSTPADISSCSVALSFTSGLDVSLTATWLSMPATAQYPGCTTTKRVTGQQWSTQSGQEGEILTVTGDGTATTARSGCVNATDDLAAMPVTGISIESGNTDYQISNGILTVTSGNLTGTYKK